MTTPVASPASGGGGAGGVGSNSAEAFVRRHPSIITFGRVGWVAKGVVYALTGTLALKVGTDRIGGSQDGEEANQSGAISAVAQQRFGPALLILLAIGLFLYSAWRVVTVLLPAENELKAWLTRIGHAASAIVYLTLGLSAISLARSPGNADASEGGEDAKVERLTADVLGWTGGRYVVGLAGLVVLAIGVAFAWNGISGDFAKHVQNRRVGPFSWDAIRTMGTFGWIGRGAMMGLIGWFVLRAAATFDASEAHGLDESLRRVADQSLGQVLILVVALGLIIYGAFCLITSQTVKLVASDDRTAAS